MARGWYRVTDTGQIIRELSTAISLKPSYSHRKKGRAGKDRIWWLKGLPNKDPVCRVIMAERPPFGTYLSLLIGLQQDLPACVSA